MPDSPRHPLRDKALALLAGPYLLGQKALSLVFLPDKDAPPEPPPGPSPLRITVTPPEHAIKRRG
ncbi:MAG TPA: hypothetical protein VJ486_01080 [Geothrix sp.]|nr:hypothetical protein [Geothrix sp.]